MKATTGRVCLAAFLLASPAAAPSPVASPPIAQFTDGRLVFPTAYREWIYLSSGLDMSYSPQAMPGHSMFDNVFAEPGAWRTFMKSGSWPEGTILVLEVRGAAEKGSINQSGRFQTADVMVFEVHMKDTRRFAGGWGFFSFAGSAAGKRIPAPAAQIPVQADCYSCHRQHAAVDTTFVQFYPTLLPVAKQHGTVQPAQ